MSHNIFDYVETPRTTTPPPPLSPGLWLLTRRHDSFVATKQIAVLVQELPVSRIPYVTTKDGKKPYSWAFLLKNFNLAKPNRIDRLTEVVQDGE